MKFFKTEKEKLQARLRKARRRGDLEKMRAALDDGAEVDYVTENHPELYLAAYYDQRDNVRLLLEYKADPNYKNSSGYTSLMSAANDGYFEIAEMLIKAGADVNAAHDNGKTPLHYAAARGQGGIIKLLLENGADANAVDYRMNTPADLADKEYPRLADLLRGKKPGDEAEAEAPAENVQGWRLTAQDEVSTIVDKPEIGYRLTETFNFGTGMYTRIASNLQSGAESQTVRFFDEFTSRSAIDKARQALEHLGGHAAEEAGKLAKPALPKPGKAGG